MHQEHHHCSHGRLFPAEAAARLDEPTRKSRQPPETLIGLLDLFSGAKVLDFGAGTGFFAVPIAQHLRKLGANGKVWAVDSQPAMFDHLRAKLAGLDLAPIETLVGSTDELLQMEAGNIDRVLLANVLHEVPDRPKLYAALAHILAPQGLVLIVDWHPEGSTDHGPPKEHRLDPKSVGESLSQSGFNRIEISPCFSDHYSVRAIRS